MSTYSSIIHVEGIAGSLFPQGVSLFCATDIIAQPLYIASTTTATPSVEWFHNGTSVSFASTYTVNSSPPSHNGIGNYTVVLTDISGCINTLNTIGIDTTACSGGGNCHSLVPLPYTTSLCNTGLGTVSYDFTSPNGSVVNWWVDNGPITTGTSFSVDFDEAGIYMVKALYNGCLLGT